MTQVIKEGVSTTYSRVVSGNLATTTITHPAGQRVIVADLAIGRVKSIKDELNRTTTFTYDGSGRLQRMTLPEGNYTEYTYDARGNVTQEQAVPKAGSGLTAITASAVFPASCTNQKTCNSPTSITDVRGKTTDYSYDPTHGGLLTITAPAPTTGTVRPQTRYSYALISSPVSGHGGTYLLTGTSACQTQASCAGSADEVKSTVVYGANMLPTSASAGSGNGSLTATSAITYDPAGNLLTVDGPLAGTADTVRYRYDAARQLVGMVSPDPDGGGALKPRALRATYNADGQVTKVEQGTVTDQSDTAWAAFASLQRGETDYDANARPTVQRIAAGTTIYALTQSSYDALGRPDCIAQRMNPAAYGALPASACTLTTQGSFGPDRIVKNVYDAASQVTQLRTAVGTTLEAAEVSSTYSNNGQLVTVTDGENNRTTFEYDGHDRPTRIYYPSPTKGAGTSNLSDFDQVSYESLNGGVQNSSLAASARTRAGEVIAFTYDALGRQTFKDLPGTEPDVTYGYDLLGRMTSASQPGQAVSFSYDALSRKVGETGPFGTVTSTYDLAGRRTSLRHPDGFTVNQSFLVTGEMTQITQPGAGIFDPPTVLVSFGYDDLGRRSSLSRANGTVTSYSYDPVSRLSQQVQDLAGTAQDLTLGFSYNPASQIISNSRSNDVYAWTAHGSGTSASPSNGLNQLTSLGGAGISHDAKGNITYDPVSANGFGYSSENLLTSVTGAGWSATLGYDPLMRLFLTGSVRNLYDGEDRIGEYNGAGTQTSRVIYGPVIDEPLVQFSGTGLATRQFLHADERGSVVATSENAGGVVNFGRFDEAGKSQNYASRYGYAGMPIETLTYLYYARTRFYNFRLGRFMQPDPIGYEGGMNLYAYVSGDPVNFTDPFGLEAQNTGGAPLPPKPRVTCTGSHIANSCGGGGVAGSLSPGNVLSFGGAGGGLSAGGGFVCRKNCGASTIAPNGDIVVTAPTYQWVSSGLGFYARDGRYVKNPYFRKSPWSNTFDSGVGIMFAGPIAVIGGVEFGGAVALTSFTNTEMGAIIGWGGGRSAAADAIARAARITPQVVRQMRIQGLTRAEAAYWHSLYSQAAAAGRGLPVSSARAQLMLTILRNW